MSSNIPEKYADRIARMIQCDTNTIHFFQSVEDGCTLQLSSELFPDGVEDPLGYIRESGIVEESSLPVFDVFRAKIESGISSGIGSNSIGTDISLRLPGSAKYVMYHMYALFLRDGDNRITDIHFNLRPYSLKEQFERDVLTYFTSDKNPKLFTKRCKNTIIANPDKDIAFIQFDVERFKLINETYGVEKGDELLQFFSDSLALVCSEEQPYCRLTADVFMIVTVFDSREWLIEFIRRVESMLGGYHDMEYRLVFGVAVVDDREAHTRRHGDNASLARQLIKGNALENIGFYEPNMKSRLQKKQEIEDDMHKALQNGEFVMFLQPKHSIKTGRIIGAEALARWQHPTKGMISPGDFIPVFEENGFILKLDMFIWEQACVRIRSWMDSGIEPVPISVNVSREYIRTFDVVENITSLLKRYDIPISLLELEITESVDGIGVEDVVSRMKEAGFKMLMDDFGSGYSSLNMLKTTQFDVLKIDRSFLSEFMESSRGRKIIEHTISMSQDIGLDIIAEGVETVEQAEFLSECGCDSAQGFYYSRPIPIEEFDKRLKEINV